MSRRRAATSKPRRQTGRSAPTSRPSGGTIVLLVTVLAIGAAALAIAALNRSTSSPPPAASQIGASSPGLATPSFGIPESLASGMALGRSSAPVTLEIWSDYQCPYCGELARSYLPRIARDFVATGDVRIVAQDISFLDRGVSTESTDAAVAAACASEQGRFWAFHDLLMWNQAGENRGAFSRQRLAAMANQVRLDMAAWNACRAAQPATQALTARVARAAALGIGSTPTLVINGQAIVGLPRSYDVLAATLRQAIAAGSPGS